MSRGGAAMFDTETSALLIVDMQNDYLDERGGFAQFGLAHPEYGWDMDGLRSTIGPIAELRDAFRRVGRPVIFIAMVHDAAYMDAQWPHWRMGLTGPGKSFLVEGTWGAEIVDELTPLEGDLVVRKRAYNGFADTTLDIVLRRLGVTHCVICGITTAVCVSSTTRGAVDRNYSVTLVSDATAETVPDLHEAETRILGMAFASEVCSAAAVIARLEKGTAQAEEQQEISVELGG